MASGLLVVVLVVCAVVASCPGRLEKSGYKIFGWDTKNIPDSRTGPLFVQLNLKMSYMLMHNWEPFMYYVGTGTKG